MTTPDAALPLSLAVAMWLPDGWHDIAAGSLTATADPVFYDSRTGLLVSPGDWWFQFTEPDGTVIAMPMRAAGPVKLAAAVVPHAVAAAQPATATGAAGPVAAG